MFFYIILTEQNWILLELSKNLKLLYEGLLIVMVYCYQTLYVLLSKSNDRVQSWAWGCRLECRMKVQLIWLSFENIVS
jgi:hypothetical protein